MRKFLSVLSVIISILMLVSAVPTFAVESESGAEPQITPKTDFTNPEFYKDANGNDIILNQAVHYAPVVEGDLDWKIGDASITADEKKAMAKGVREKLEADISLSVTGLAGPGGDEYGNPVGTVFIGCDSPWRAEVREYYFAGDRDSVRQQAVTAALKLALETLRKE